ncbi:MAG: 2TM domain-containing protein [Acidimicrobiia bacterium]|nr:2TM domain-containing protein [Acidimicrobiia bacterium]
MTSADSTPEERARKRLDDYNGLLWHVATYVIINIFLWALDWAQGDGITWAFWVTIFWGIGLAFHVASYWIDETRQGSRYERFLEDERKRDAGA